MRILLVEDDEMIGAAVQASLRDAACAADWVRDGAGVAATLALDRYDLVLLDLGLPGLDGIDVLRRMRQSRCDLPVIVITARDGLDDRIAGLDVGADDYMLKPFEMRELLARIRAVLRRRSGSADCVLDSGVLSLNLVTREACRASQAPVVLTNREFALLQALMQRPGAILSRADLEGRIYGWGEEVDSNAIEYLIHAIRRKLGADSVRNVRGAGWMVPRQP